MTLDLELLEAIFTNEGNDLRSIAEQNCVMLVFLRQFGCAFCREALDDVSDVKTELDQRNIKLVFVHLAEENYGDIYLEKFGLKGEEHISDPDMSLYEYFGLQKGSFRELYGLKIWTRLASLKFTSDVNAAYGNVKQMPGIFLIQKGEIINSFIHKSAAERPDYLAIADFAYKT
jgi:peroxiredoxin